MKNKYDRLEFAGAFGDLGTLIPFLVAYITVLDLNPVGILFAFGLSKILIGLYYRTPIPVQPMKAIGAAAVVTPALASPGVIMGAGLATGLFWLLMGATNTITYIAKLAEKPVIRGIMLGLGLSFVGDGIRMMGENFLVALVGLIITYLLLNNKKVPAMFVLLLYGIGVSALLKPELFVQIAKIKPAFALPDFTLMGITLKDFLAGALFFALPQLPLTLGNAVIAVTAENNKLFPEMAVTERRVSITTGIMNLFSACFGGVPMCHGAGGMAGHIRFGARTGGALVILGGLLIALSLFFSGSIVLLFQLFPKAVLGVILFFAGTELSLTARDIGGEKNDFYILVVTAGIALYHIGAAFLAGIVSAKLLKAKKIAI